MNTQNYWQLTLEAKQATQFEESYTDWEGMSKFPLAKMKRAAKAAAEFNGAIDIKEFPKETFNAIVDMVAHFVFEQVESDGSASSKEITYAIAVIMNFVGKNILMKSDIDWYNS